MCILFVALNQHPNYPLIVCANRDEYHQRPTKRMHLWPEHSLYAGKDLQAGGTWFGINETKQFAALTNYRLPTQFDSKKTSRGEIVINALTTNSEDFQHQLSLTSSQYNDFNLLYGDEKSLYCFDSHTQKLTTLTTGTFSLCNGALNDLWPKMKRGKEKLKQLVSTHTKIKTDDLFTLMQDHKQTEESLLPNTGISKESERLLSSIFITSPDYGTRSTTILIKDQHGHCTLIERSYNPLGRLIDEVNFNF
ncbi:NRDE family protein [Thalassotalea piscium]